MIDKNQPFSTVFLDANVVVKILEGYEVPELFEIADTSEIYTSVICFNIIVYLWEIGKIKCSKEDFNKFFANIILLEVTQEQCFKALEVAKYKDVEDAIQIICAKNNQMDLLLTYDKKMFNKYRKDNGLVITLCR